MIFSVSFINLIPEFSFFNLKFNIVRRFMLKYLSVICIFVLCACSKSTESTDITSTAKKLIER